MAYPRVAPAIQRLAVLAAVVLLLLVVLAAGSGCAGDGDTSASPATGETAPVLAHFAEEPPGEWNGEAVRFEALPPEAHETLALIATDGPYPYRQDGSTFQNREGILPDRQVGFYREFTVDTPGSPDRGARRVVVGDDIAAYYTADHYDSFRFIAP